jgi:hypothetical protein
MSPIEKLCLEDDDEDNIHDEVESSVWGHGGNAGDEVEEDEDLHRREEELQKELQFATLRVNELKRTLEVTKSFLGDRAPTRERLAASREGAASGGLGGGPHHHSGSASRLAAAGAVGPRPSAAIPGGIAQRSPGFEEPPIIDEELEYEDDDDDDDAFSSSEEEIYNDEAAYSKPPLPQYGAPAAASDDVKTVRVVIAPRVASSSSPPRNRNYQNLQDAPSPSGRLGDRISQLRNRLVEALGKDSFLESYQFLRQHEEVGGDGRIHALCSLLFCGLC